MSSSGTSGYPQHFLKITSPVTCIILFNEAVHDDDPILSDISEEMRHRIPPNIDPLKKYATYVELIQKNHKTVKY